MGTDDGVASDPTVLDALLEESRDLHADAMRAAQAALPELAEIGQERAAGDLGGLGGLGNLLPGGALANVAPGGALANVAAGGALGSLIACLLAGPARADTALDVQILQTASSLEALAVAVYAQALGTGPDGHGAPSYGALAGLAPTTAHDALAAFFTETMRQHGEHKKVFQAQTVALDLTARVQDAANPKFLAALNTADLGTPDKLVDFATQLEKVATDTYLLDLGMVQDSRTKALLASVMGVEAQHLATLRTFAGLLKADARLLVVPFPQRELATLPHTAGTVAFPDALEKVNGPDQIAEPTSGAAG